MTNKFEEMLWTDPEYEEKCWSPKAPSLEGVSHN